MKSKIFCLPMLVVLSINTIPACKKTAAGERLPPETHEGNFTFGFKADGVVYTATGEGGLLASDHVRYTMLASDSSITISAGSTSSLKNKFSVLFTIKYPGDTGVCLMKTYPYEGIFSDKRDGNIAGGAGIYHTNGTYQGSVHIKYFDGTFHPPVLATVLSGTFEMEGISAGGKVIRITEGRFDIGK